MFTNLSERDRDRAVLVRFAIDEDAASDDAELLAADLFTLGATGIEESTDLGRTVALIAGFPNRSAAAEALDRLPARWRAVALVEVPDDTWFDGWRAYARARRAGRHLIVHPPWVPLHTDPPAGPSDLVLAIDPGRSFGSGAHPTTRLVLAELEGLVTTGSRVVDLGCGSGVLAIAARLLGAGHVLAIDTDPAAVEATTANCRRNGVDVTVLAGSLPPDPHGGRYDVVAANIGANTLIGLAPRLLRWGGVLVLSGFFADRAGEVAEAYERLGATARNTVSDADGWTALTLLAPTS